MREEGWKGKNIYWEAGRDKVCARRQNYIQLYFISKILYSVYISEY